MRQKWAHGCAQSRSAECETLGQGLTDASLLPSLAAGWDSHGIRPQGQARLSEDRSRQGLGPSGLTHPGSIGTIAMS